jgi:protein-L-isoaspartate(D-aspartate) O-methyltransferase
MSDSYRVERERMVENQLKKRGIRNAQLLEAFRKVPRHQFLPGNLRGEAYTDGPSSIGEGQTISQPYMTAIMTQSAEVVPGDRVLEIGTGSGYQSAILAELGAEVYTVERIPELFEQARETLGQLHYDKVHTRMGNGTLGWEAEAPFDIILITAGAPEIPGPLLEQLAMKGRLVIPLEEGYSQVLYVVRRSQKGFHQERGERCTFVPLMGQYGWKKDPRRR